MLRASSVAERAGVPSSSLVCEGFLGQASTTSVGLGMPNLPSAKVPGHTGAQGLEELRANILDVTLDEVIRTLTDQPAPVVLANEPAPRDIVFSGSFEEVNRLFLENQWSDGLPIVPPTPDKIEAFLKFTRRDPDEVIGKLLPDNRAATVWSVAANGVMAGCRPEYMPVLVALIEAMADPQYGVRAQRQYTGLRDLDNHQWSHHSRARIQLRARGAARRLSSEYFYRALLAAVPAQCRGILAAPERQGDFRKHMASGAGRERSGSR